MLQTSSKQKIIEIAKERDIKAGGERGPGERDQAGGQVWIQIQLKFQVQVQIQIQP